MITDALINETIDIIHGLFVSAKREIDETITEDEDMVVSISLPIKFTANDGGIYIDAALKFKMREYKNVASRFIDDKQLGLFDR